MKYIQVFISEFYVLKSYVYDKGAM